MALINDKGINEYEPVRKAYDRAKEILGKGNPDKAELSNIVKQFDSHPEAVEWLRLEEEGRYEDVYERIREIVKPDVQWIADCGKNILPVYDGFNGKDVAMAEGNWHECVSQLKKNNLEILTMRQLAELRMKYGKESIYCTKSSSIGEGMVCMPNGDLFVVSKSSNLILGNSKEATEAHMAEKEFYYKGIYKDIEDTLNHSHKKGKPYASNNMLYVPERYIPDNIKTNEFESSPIASFLFKNLASHYGKFLLDTGIKDVLFRVPTEEYAKKQKDAFSRTILAANLLDFNSSIYCNDFLNHMVRAFGMRKEVICDECGARLVPGTWGYSHHVCSFC
ncbi:MAG: hypothetical protein V1734_02010 [Nanoarchaeota archaeon]